MWLRCVVAGQYFSDRLLMDVRAVERDLAFWKSRLERGNNALFLAVARGPRQFAGAISALVRRLRGQEPVHRLQSSGRIEQRVRPVGMHSFSSCVTGPCRVGGLS